MDDEGGAPAVDELAFLVKGGGVGVEECRLVRVCSLEKESEVFVGGVVGGVALLDEEEDTVEEAGHHLEVAFSGGVIARVVGEHIVGEDGLAGWGRGDERLGFDDLRGGFLFVG